MKSPRGRLNRKVLFVTASGIGAVMFLACWWNSPSVRPHGERKEHWSGLSFARQTDVQFSPRPAARQAGWDSERVWSGNDDWEPFVAADPSSPYVYQMTTRFNAEISGIFIRISVDRGATWGPDRLVAPVTQWQADPQVQVAGNGTVVVVWLDGPDWKSKLIKSTDHGASWSAPVVVAPARPWTDHPWLVVSPDARDIYVGLNTDDSYFVASHDGGQTFGAPVRTSRTPNHWWCHNGGAIGPDGTVYFVAINFLLDYRGMAEINVIRSSDGGASWQVALVDVSGPPPGCGRSPGCDYGFLSSTAGLAIDRAGNLLVAYNAGATEGAPQQLWVKTSRDGANWSARRQVSQPNDAASNGFPAVAAGQAPGDFRVVWQGNADGNLRGWNTFYRRTTDGGKEWSETIQLSDRSSGAPYKSGDGFFFPYGDYLSLSVDGDGRNHVIWGEGASYNGPGGVWYTRGNSDLSP
jgi:hypothetical protein